MSRTQRGLLYAAAVAVAASAAIAAAPQLPPPVVPKSLISSGDPVKSCESLKSVTLLNTTIESAVVDPGNQATPASCRVTAWVTHPPATDKVTVWIALPSKDWNGRFQGVGGGGFSGGSAMGAVGPLRAGYAAGSTDTGHAGASGSFALEANGQLNWPSIRDNAYLGIHDMTVTGKALAESFYGTAPKKSYFNGCSTGGRQGLSEAQRYPADYDGILAGAPAINWTKLHVEQMWGSVVMLETKTFVPACKFNAATQGAVAACDGIDGVKDGVIEDPHRCKFDPKTLVGTTAGECGAITDADATVIRKVWEGPKKQDGSFLWYGLERGGDFNGLTGINANASPPTVRPNPITMEWWRYFLNKNPQWQPNDLTYASYEKFFNQSVSEFGEVLATDNPNLAAFRDRGGKIVMWHGWADPLIYPGGSIDYFTRVQKQMGGAAKTAEFMRFFLAPGVGHCGGGAGPAPTGQFEAVVKWVEEKQEPDTLDALRRDQTGAVIRSRPLCQYPLVARYKGTGSTDEAVNFECRANF